MKHGIFDAEAAYKLVAFDSVAAKALQPEMMSAIDQSRLIGVPGEREAPSAPVDPKTLTTAELVKLRSEQMFEKQVQERALQMLNS